jgi:hypothetical protein
VLNHRPRKWFLRSIMLAMVLMLGTLFCGAIFFPEAPIRECGQSYCGKYGVFRVIRQSAV